MKRGTVRPLPVAWEFEAVQAVTRGPYLNRKLYVVATRPGLFRRIKRGRPDAPGAARDGSFPAVHPGGFLIELVPDPAANEELTAAVLGTGGTTLPASVVRTATAEPPRPPAVHPDPQEPPDTPTAAAPRHPGAEDATLDDLAARDELPPDAAG